MKRLVLLALLFAFSATSVSAAAPWPKYPDPPTCTVTPAVATPGSVIVVNCQYLAHRYVKSAWFLFVDRGPLTVQGVSTLDCGPCYGGIYGDNGSWAWFSALNGTAQATFNVKNDPGHHRIGLERDGRAFASVDYEVQW